MLKIGEKLNSSIPATAEALNKGDNEYLEKLILSQSECGADFLDINATLCASGEPEALKMLIEMCLRLCSCGIMLDSSNAPVLAKAARWATARPLILNSVTLADRLPELAPVAAELGAGVVALPIGPSGMPHTVEERLKNAGELIGKLTAYGIAPENIYIDALAETCSIDTAAPAVTLGTISAIKQEFPEVKTICGLSNVSFGLPRRKYINAAFLSMAVYCGLDAAIMDVMSLDMRGALAASRALTGQDEFCMDYIAFTREIEQQK